MTSWPVLTLLEIYCRLYNRPTNSFFLLITKALPQLHAKLFTPRMLTCFCI